MTVREGESALSGGRKWHFGVRSAVVRGAKHGGVEAPNHAFEGFKPCVWRLQATEVHFFTAKRKNRSTGH